MVAAKKDETKADEATTVNGLSDAEQEKRTQAAAKAEEARAKDAATPEDVEAEDGEFAGQFHTSESYIVATDDHFGVGVVRLSKVGGVNDDFVIPVSKLKEVIDQLKKVKLPKK